MTVKEFLFGLPRPNKIHIKITLDMVTKLLDLSSLLDRRPQTLSGGERQRYLSVALFYRSPTFVNGRTTVVNSLHLRAEILPLYKK